MTDITRILDEALAGLPAAMDTPQARVLLIAIGLQESRLTHRVQLIKDKKTGELVPRGPARGLWQFELGGGVAGVLNHRLVRDRARALTGYPKVSAAEVHKRLSEDDVLAAQLARLLLWTDPKPLPTEAADAWNYYIRVWRPGKPHPQTWEAFWDQAEAVVYGTPAAS